MSENINDINHLDPDDEGLSQIFGDRFHDLSSTPAAGKTAIPRNSTPPKKKPISEGTERLKDEHEVESTRTVVSDYNWLPKLKEAARGIFPQALLSVFFFWCQLTSRMDPATAVAAMFGCVALVFFRVGRVCAK